MAERLQEANQIFIPVGSGEIFTFTFKGEADVQQMIYEGVGLYGGEIIIKGKRQSVYADQIDFDSKQGLALGDGTFLWGFTTCEDGSSQGLRISGVNALGELIIEKPLSIEMLPELSEPFVQ